MGIDLATLIKAVGIFGISAIIFAETGLFLGFFLPGDSLLFTAGFLASQGYLHIGVLIGATFLAAFLGDNLGYFLGRKIGPRIFRREDSFFFHKDHLQRAGLFYQKHGPRAVIFGRFIPIVRTFVAVLAGVGKMRYPTFLVFGLAGEALWAAGITSLGFFLGKRIPNANRFIFPLILLIIILSFLPLALSLLRDPDIRSRIREKIRRLFGS